MWPGWLSHSGQFTPNECQCHPSAVGRTQGSESSPVKDRRFTTVPRNQCSVIRWCGPYCYFSVTWTDLVLPYLVSSSKLSSAEAVYVQRGLSWRDWDDRWLIKSHNCYLLTQPMCVCVWLDVNSAMFSAIDGYERSSMPWGRDHGEQRRRYRSAWIYPRHEVTERR